MSERLDIYRVDDPGLLRRRSALLVPAVLATCIGLALIALSVLLNVVAEVLLHSNPDWLTPAGATYIPPSHAERVRALVRSAVPIVSALGFLVLTWRFRHQGRQVATYLCALAVIVMGAAAIW